MLQLNPGGQNFYRRILLKTDKNIGRGTAEGEDAVNGRAESSGDWIGAGFPLADAGNGIGETIPVIEGIDIGIVHGVLPGLGQDLRGDVPGIDIRALDAPGGEKIGEIPLIIAILEKHIPGGRSPLCGLPCGFQGLGFEDLLILGQDILGDVSPNLGGILQGVLSIHGFCVLFCPGKQVAVRMEGLGALLLGQELLEGGGQFVLGGGIGHHKGVARHVSDVGRGIAQHTHITPGVPLFLKGGMVLGAHRLGNGLGGGLNAGGILGPGGLDILVFQLCGDIRFHKGLLGADGLAPSGCGPLLLRNLHLLIGRKHLVGGLLNDVQLALRGHPADEGKELQIPTGLLGEEGEVRHHLFGCGLVAGLNVLVRQGHGLGNVSVLNGIPGQMVEDIIPDGLGATGIEVVDRLPE